MRLQPFVSVDGLSFDTTPAQLLERRGPPLRRAVNAVALEEWDYGDAVYRFQASGRLEEVTRRAPVLYLCSDEGVVDLPFAALLQHVQQQDEAAFERAGFWVSPRLGLAFVPQQPDWVTALAAHCLDSWHAL